MLKFTGNFKELEQYGFEYDSSLFECYGYEDDDDDAGHAIYINVDTREIELWQRDDKIRVEEEYLDKLFDLINAGLVQKSR